MRKLILHPIRLCLYQLAYKHVIWFSRLKDIQSQMQWLSFLVNPVDDTKTIFRVYRTLSCAHTAALTFDPPLSGPVFSATPIFIARVPTQSERPCRSVGIWWRTCSCVTDTSVAIELMWQMDLIYHYPAASIPIKRDIHGNAPPNILEVISFRMLTQVTATVVCCILMQILSVIVSQKRFSFWGTRPPIPGIRPWTPLGSPDLQSSFMSPQKSCEIDTLATIASTAPLIATLSRLIRRPNSGYHSARWSHHSSRRWSLTSRELNYK